jgi:8-oxo-dGTP diphosphatase
VAGGVGTGVEEAAAAMADLTGTDEVLAAGGVPWRRGGDGLEVLVVHRPKYDDWTFPKGKLDGDESDEKAAEREVFEETGIRGELGDELPTTRYLDRHGRRKRVRYWAIEPGEGAFRPNQEVDQARWLPVGEARQLLSYDHDRAVVDALQALVGAGP